MALAPNPLALQYTGSQTQTWQEGLVMKEKRKSERFKATLDAEYTIKIRAWHDFYDF